MATSSGLMVPSRIGACPRGGRGGFRIGPKAAESICSKNPTGFTRPARADGAVALRFVLMVEWVERQ